MTESLLLYLEDCAVNKSGRLNTECLSDVDREFCESWCKSGYIQFGRICLEDCKDNSTLWVKLSELAMSHAHAYRKQRSIRLWNSKNYKTTKEIK